MNPQLENERIIFSISLLSDSSTSLKGTWF